MRRPFLIAFLFLLVFFVSAIVYVQFNGKRMTVLQLERLFQRSVKVKDVRFVFPLGIRIDEIEIDGLLWAEHVRIHGNINTLLEEDIHVERIEINRPSVWIHRDKLGKIVFDEPSSPQSESNADAAVARPRDDDPGMGPRLIADAVTIRDGKFTVADHFTKDPPTFTINNVSLTAAAVPLSGQSVETTFEAEGLVLNTSIPIFTGRLQAKGAVNWAARSMNVDALVYGEGEVVLLTSKFVANNNDMMITGSFVLNEQKTQGLPGVDPAFRDLMMGVIEAAGLEANVDFVVQTQMDHWQLSNIEFSGNLLNLEAPKNDQQPQTNGLEELGRKLLGR